jgi:hypothetical protein
MSRRWVRDAAVAVARHPSLWTTALRQLAALAPPGWWRRSPHLPLPAPAYLRFRLQTAYGDPEREPDAGDVLTYLHWCRAWPALAGGRHPA